MEKEMATHSSMLAWKIPWTEEPTYSPWGRQELGTTEQLHFHFSLSCIGEGNGNLLQCSCLENPRDGGAWWAAVYGVAQSDTTEATSQQQQRISKHYYNLVAHMVKNLPAMQRPEINSWVRKITWRREGYHPWSCKESNRTE